MVEIGEFFQIIFPFLKPGKKEKTKVGARVIDKEVAEGLRVQQQKRAEFAATAPPPPKLVRDDPDRPGGYDSRYDRRKDPSGLEGPSGERKKVK